MHSPNFYLYFSIAGYGVCALLVVLWVHILTRRGRSCRRKTCTYYVRYIPSGDPLLMHEDFHFWESECRRLTDEVEQHIHRGYVPPLGLVEELRRIRALLRD